MKQLLLATTALVISGPVFAADMRMPVKAPAVAAPVAYSWTGCYAGGHIGVGSSRTSIAERVEPFGLAPFFAPPDTPIPVDSDAGVVGGVQVGCDYQFATHWVVGAAGDFTWTDLDGKTSDPFFAGKNGGPIIIGAKTEWLASATARLGYAWNTWLIYGKGGAAWAHDRISIPNIGLWGNPVVAVCATGGVVGCNPAGSATTLGWTAGFGFEWAFAGHWSTGVEYNHYQFNNNNFILTDASGIGGSGVPAAGPVHVDQHVDTLTVNLNYRFGGP
jgi:outer membrane immunogenic protein